MRACNSQYWIQKYDASHTISRQISNSIFSQSFINGRILLGRKVPEIGDTRSRHMHMASLTFPTWMMTSKAEAIRMSFGSIT